MFESLYESVWFQSFYAFIILSYTFLGAYQMYLIVSDLSKMDKDHLIDQKAPKADNRVIVLITTNGMATGIVEKIIATTRSYELGVEIYVIKEERDPFRYSCDEVIVPKDYKTKNGSRNKMRALQYGAEWLHEKGYGKETYVCHLDDDSLADKAYLGYVIHHMTGAGGQGCIRLREFGRHLFSSLADIIRISNCEAWCSHYNKKNKPQFVHGEGLIVRADVEWENRLGLWYLRR